MINNKVYIGQTVGTIEKRFQEHVNDSKNPQFPLHKAISLYGIENFKIEEIEKCEIEKLNEKEIYWIAQYDSFNSKKGYNATLGGSGKQLYNLNEDEVIQKYYELGTVTSVSKFFNCCSEVIHNILLNNDIEIKSAMDIAKEKGFKTYALDDKQDIIKEFDTLFEAGKWVFDNCEHNAKNAHSCKVSILYAILKSGKAYGYYWKSNAYDGKYIEDWLNHQSIVKKNYIRPKNADKNVCCKCKINLKLKKSKYCCSCAKEERNKNNLIELEAKISKKDLIGLVRKKSFDELGKIYGVSGNCIKQWCKKYCIPFRKEDINNISDADWETECNLSKEDYEAKYINTKKAKSIITDQEIIDKYLEVKSLTKVGEFFNKDISTIKKILKDNGIKLFNANLEKSKSLGKVQRLDKKTNEVLQTYDCLVDAVDWLCEYYNREDNRPNYKKNVCKAVNHNIVAFGFKWKRINEGD